MARDQLAFLGHEAGHLPGELGHAGRDLRNLIRTMGLRVLGVGLEPLKRQLPLHATAAPTGAAGSDLYSGVVFLADGGRLRVAVCRDGSQWFSQHRAPLDHPSRHPWVSVSFRMTRAGLETVAASPEFRGVTGLAAFIAGLPGRCVAAGRDGASGVTGRRRGAVGPFVGTNLLLSFKNRNLGSINGGVARQMRTRLS
jgi:hypothetical protein